MMTAIADVPDLLRCSDQAVGWARLMLQRDLAVVIDCETTDLPGALCEVAVVDTSGRVLLNSLVHPCLPITRAAGKVHNITEEMVAAAPTFPELFDDILRVTAGRRVLAYNAAFDRQCLLADAQRHRRNAEHLEDPGTWGCVMRARSAWVGTPDHFYRLEAGHRALGDAIAALNVLQTIAADPWPVAGAINRNPQLPKRHRVPRRPSFSAVGHRTQEVRVHAWGTPPTVRWAPSADW